MKKTIYVLLLIAAISGCGKSSVPVATPPNNTGGWTTIGTAGFSAGAVLYPKIVVDGNGTPYVAYADSGNGYKATVMKYNGSSWVPVGNPGFSAGNISYPSMAIDSNGTPYVVYEDIGNNILGGKATVMRYNGSSWVAVGNPGFSAGNVDYTSIAIDGKGALYVVYEDEANNSACTVMKFNGSNWVPVGSPGFSAYNYIDVTGGTSIAIDGSGTPYVLFAEGTGEPASVMKYNGSGWVIVGSSGFSKSEANWTSIVIDANSTPYVVYEDYSLANNNATVMKFNGSDWAPLGNAGFSAGSAGTTSIAIDRSDNVPYVAYCDGGNSEKASVMKYSNGSWVNVGSAGFSLGKAFYTSIAIYNGTSYVVYKDYANAGKATVMKYVN